VKERPFDVNHQTPVAYAVKRMKWRGCSKKGRGGRGWKGSTVVPPQKKWRSQSPKYWGNQGSNGGKGEWEKIPNVVYTSC